MKLAWKPVIAAFVAGGIVGAGLGVWSAPRFMHRRWDRGRFHDRMQQEFSSKLKLTPEQQAQVGAILEATRKKIDALRAETRPRFEEVRKSTSGEIRQLLTPEQQTKFDQMEGEWESKAKHFRERWKGPGSGP